MYKPQPGYSPVIAQRVAVGHEKRQLRFPVEHVPLHIRLLAFADIGRITHEYMCMSLCRYMREHIHLPEIHTHPVALRIPPGYAERGIRNVPCAHPRSGQEPGQRNGDASASRTDIHYAHLRLALKIGHNPIYQLGGFGTGNQDTGSDMKGQAAKRRFARNVLERLETLETGKNIFQRCVLFFRKFPIFAIVQIEGRKTEHFSEDAFCQCFRLRFGIEAGERADDIDINRMHNDAKI